MMGAWIQLGQGGEDLCGVVLQSVVLGAAYWGIASGQRLDEPDESKLLSEEEPDKDGSRSSPSWWIIFLFIPFVSGIVGYITNVIALKMTFYPVEFWGWKLWQPEGQPFGLFGWQGIIPAKAKAISGKMMDLFLESLIDVQEIFGRIDPSDVAIHLNHGARFIYRDAIAIMARNTVASAWDGLPDAAQQETLACVEKESEQFIKLMMEAMRHNVLQILDLKGLAERRAETKKGLMSSMFIEIGHRECRFIELSGFVFGLLFGYLQALLYFYYQGAWVLPTAGFLVGWLTNYIALKAVFEPAEKRSVMGITIQGVFTRRQQDAAAQIAALAQREFLRADLLVDEMLHGTNKEAFRELLKSVCSDYVNRQYSPTLRILFLVVLGESFSDNIRNSVVQIISDRMTEAFPAAYPVMERQMDIENTLTYRIERMKATDFVNLLRPAFEEDEIKLILVGGVLGLLVGVVQQFALVPFLP